MMNYVKKRDSEFQIEKHEDDKDIIETLIKQGESPEEIKAYMEVITTF